MRKGVVCNKYEAAGKNDSSTKSTYIMHGVTPKIIQQRRYLGKSIAEIL